MLLPIQSSCVFHEAHDITGKEVLGTDFQVQQCRQAVAVCVSGCLMFEKAFKKKKRNGNGDLSLVSQFPFAALFFHFTMFTVLHERAFCAYIGTLCGIREIHFGGGAKTLKVIPKQTQHPTSAGSGYNCASIV